MFSYIYIHLMAFLHVQCLRFICFAFCFRFLPNRGQTVARMNHKFFCGTYLESGDVFVSASQGWVFIMRCSFACFLVCLHHCFVL